MKKVQVAGLLIAVAILAMAFTTMPTAAIPATRFESLNTYLTDRYDAAEGGYNLDGEGTSRIEATYSAAVLWDAIGYLDARPPTVDLVKMANFTQKTQWDTVGESSDRYGGFGSYIAGPVGVKVTHEAIALWKIVTAQSGIPGLPDIEINATAALMFINKTQTTSGGFSNEVGGNADIVSTYLALDVIETLASETPWTLDSLLLNKTGTIVWILNCKEGDAYKLSPASTTAGVTPSAAALLSLSFLDALPAASAIQATKTWIMNRQDLNPSIVELTGGFEEGVLTNDTNLLSTYYALKTMDLLDAIEEVNETVTQFVMNCQSLDGAWANAPGFEVGFVQFISNAMQCLTLLEENHLTLLSMAHPGTPSAPLVDWRLLFVVLFMVAAIIVGIVALRLD
ncbi:MAG: hypothetical protein KAW94_01770 [Candidatus Thorarchaeota archaeon]|nr:hypothetical protein [Candidatus Thorarchaeota archaeon]